MTHVFYLQTDEIEEIVDFLLDLFGLDEYIYCRYIDGDNPPCKYFSPIEKIDVSGYEEKIKGTRWKIFRDKNAPRVVIIYDNVKKGEKAEGINLGSDGCGVGVVITENFGIEEDIPESANVLYLEDESCIDKVREKLKEMCHFSDASPFFSSEWQGYNRIKPKLNQLK